jgi:hypothetical protein
MTLMELSGAWGKGEPRKIPESKIAWHCLFIGYSHYVEILTNLISTLNICADGS